MYYYAGAHWSEIQARNGAATTDDEFLFSHHEPFRNAVRHSYQALLELSGKRQIPKETILDFKETIAKDIAPYNLAGLCDPNKQNMYPFSMGESGDTI